MESWRKELYLAHHGILGMKWGRKNGPPYPLDAEDHSAAEKKAGWRKSLDGGSSNSETKRKKKLTKDGSGGKIKKVVDDFKSDYREGLKAKYLEKHNKRTPFHKSEGKTEADAQKFADGRMKAMKALAIVGGVAVTAMAAKYTYDHVIPQYVDRTLKEGTEFKRVVGSADSDLNRTFYMARSKGDTRKYVGLYGEAQKNAGKSPHQITGTVRKALKIASNKNAAQTFRELYESNSEFRKMAEERIRNTPNDTFGPFGIFTPAGKIAVDASKRIEAGPPKSATDFNTLYKAFNFSMVTHGKETDPALESFYEALKKKGYGGINDINDQWYSGYNTGTANIVFDIDSVTKTAVREIADEEINSIRQVESAKTLTKQILSSVGSLVVTAETVSVINTISKGKKTKQKPAKEPQSGKKKEDDS